MMQISTLPQRQPRLQQIQRQWTMVTASQLPSGNGVN